MKIYWLACVAVLGGCPSVTVDQNEGAARPTVEFDPANAIKFTIYRLTPSGSAGDPDIFGSQQYAPLLDIDVPDDP